MRDLDSVQAQLVRAQSLHQAGRFADAWALVQPLRKSIDTHGQGLRLYALIAQASGNVDAVADALRRVLILERDPPEIVGALAQTLDEAGRHDEALRLWTRLTVLLPTNADAHLNRAICAGAAGRHDIAIAASNAGLNRFPNHARLLDAKAAALKNLGQIEESINEFERAVAADANRALTRYNQAVTLRSAMRFEEACEAYGVAAKLGLSGAEFHGNWAAAEMEAGHSDRAAALYRRALQEDPGHQQSLRGFTRLKIEYLEADGFDHYQEACKARGFAVEAWIDWIAALSSHDRLEQAADVGGRALARHPGDPALLALTEFARGMYGDAASALDQIARLPAEILDSASSLISRSQLALRAGDPTLAASLAEEFTRREPDSQLGWAILGVAWRVMDDPREQWLCDYDRLVMITDVPSSEGMGPADYGVVVGDVLEPLHKTRAAPGNQSLRQGTQTSGRLFDTRDPRLLGFRDAVRAAAERAVGAIRPDPSHPFLRRISPRLNFTGSWSVRLGPGSGHHVPHFHSQGWMSSAYYARLPPVDGSTRDQHEGWLHFGKPPAMFGLDLEPRRLVEPKVGSLALFPSYLWHGTKPFRTGDRLTAAFDFRPA